MNILTGSYGNLQSGHLRGPQMELLITGPAKEGAHKVVPAIIDSGSEVSLVPEAVIAELGRGLDYGIVTVRDVAGAQRLLRSYYLNVGLNGLKFPDIELLAVPQPYAVVGRDILNLFRVSLDGPRGTWELR